MAEDKNSISSGLEYATKMPAMGRSEEDQQANIDAAKAGLQALEQRYANPNWFNVAAGFLKPQLGGFAASLGSAAEALGANTEQQRANQIPIYNARAQLGYMQAQQANKQQAAKLFQALGDKPMDAKTYRDIEALAPGSEIAVAAKAAYEGEKTNQGLQLQKQQLAVSQATQESQNARALLDSGAITREEYQNRVKDIGRFNPSEPKVPSSPTDTSNTSLAPAPGGASYNFNGKPYENAQAFMEAIPGMSPQEQKEAIHMLTVSAAGKPVGEKPEVKTEKPTIISSGLGSASGLTQEQIAAQVKPQEEMAQKRYAGLQEVGAPENYNNLNQAISNQIGLIKNNKEAAGRVSAVLAQSPLLAALNEGIGISFNGLSANIRAPIETYIRHSFDPKDQDLAMAMAQNYAKIALAQQRIGGVNPNSARNSELGLYAGLSPSLNTTPNSSLRALSHLKQDLDMTKAQFEHVNDVLAGRNAKIQLAKDEPARLSTVMTHSSFGDVANPYTEKHKAIESAFQRSIKKP